MALKLVRLTEEQMQDLMDNVKEAVEMRAELKPLVEAGVIPQVQLDAINDAIAKGEALITAARQ